MAKIEHIERRLLNWARWKVGATGDKLGYASPSLNERVDGGGYRSVGVPTLSHDAYEVDAAIGALSKDLQQTLYEVYVCESPSSVLEQRLGIGYRAVLSRVDQAHRLLLRVFEESAAKLKAAREAIQSAQSYAN